jgi:hypothetical protein
MRKIIELLLFPWLLLFSEQEETQSDHSQQPNMQEEAECHDYYYGTRVTVAPFFLYQGKTTKKTKGTFFGQADIFLPLFQTPRSILFASVRGIDYAGAPIEGNFGLGVRHIFKQFDWMFGLYTFYDRNRTQQRNFFNQITVGLELKTAKFTFDANGYIPFGKTRQKTTAFDTAILIDGVFPFKNILFRAGREIALWGIDAEVGYNVWKGLSLFAGGFYFHRNQAATVVGPFGRLYWTYDFGFSNPILFDQIHFELGGSYDNVRNERFYAGLSFSWVIGERRDQKPKGIGKRMTEYVRRDYDIISSENRKEPLQLLEKSPGSPVNVNIVTNLSELQTATGNGADVIALQGVATGAGGTTTLADNQTLTGKNYIFNVFNDEMTIQLSTGGTIENEAITISENNTIRDLICNSVSVAANSTQVGTFSLLNNSFAGDIQGWSAEFNISGSDPSHLYIKNNTFEGGLFEGFIVFANGPSDTYVDEFTDNVFTLSSQSDTVTLGNTANQTDTVINLNIGKFTGNTFNLVSTDVPTLFRPITFLCDISGAATGTTQIINIGQFEGNKMVLSGTTLSLRGVEITNTTNAVATNTTQIINITSCSSNTIQIGDRNSSQAFYIQNLGSFNPCVQRINITSLLSNEITIGAGTSNIGIYFLNEVLDPGNDQQITVGSSSSGGFFNNKITLGAGSTESIVFDNNGSGSGSTMSVNVNNSGQSLEASNFDAQVIKQGTNTDGITITP